MDNAVYGETVLRGPSCGTTERYVFTPPVKSSMDDVLLCPIVQTGSYRKEGLWTERCLATRKAFRLSKLKAWSHFISTIQLGILPYRIAHQQGGLARSTKAPLHPSARGYIQSYGLTGYVLYCTYVHCLFCHTQRSKTAVPASPPLPV